MEIVRRRETKLIEVTCSHCNSVLRCTEEEKRTLPCPICGHQLNDEENHLVCDKCNHSFPETEPEGIGVYGCYYTHCPSCGERVYFDDGIDITIDNLKLYYFSSVDGKRIDFSEIKSWIARGIKFLQNNPDELIYYTVSGDSFVFIEREVDSFYVIYTNRYRDVYIEGM